MSGNSSPSGVCFHSAGTQRQDPHPEEESASGSWCYQQDKGCLRLKLASFRCPFYLPYCVCVKLLQVYPTLCDPPNHSPPGSSVHGDSLGKNTPVGCQWPSPGDLLEDPGIEPSSLNIYVHWQTGSLALVPDRL